MSGIDTLRLLDEPFTFTQYRPLLPRQFIDEAKKCGLWLSEQELEALLGQLFGDENPHEPGASWNTCSAAATAAPRLTG